MISLLNNIFFLELISLNFNRFHFLLLFILLYFFCLNIFLTSLFLNNNCFRMLLSHFFHCFNLFQCIIIIIRFFFLFFFLLFSLLQNDWMHAALAIHSTLLILSYFDRIMCSPISRQIKTNLHSFHLTIYFLMIQLWNNASQFPINSIQFRRQLLRSRLLTHITFLECNLYFLRNKIISFIPILEFISLEMI